jgi:hypothetical protein
MQGDTTGRNALKKECPFKAAQKPQKVYFAEKYARKSGLKQLLLTQQVVNLVK